MRLKIGTLSFVLLLTSILSGCGSIPKGNIDTPLPVSNPTDEVGLNDILDSEGQAGGLFDLIPEGAGDADDIDHSLTAPIESDEPVMDTEYPIQEDTDADLPIESTEEIWNPLDDDIVEFNDDNFERIIREIVGKPTRYILYSDVKDITELDVRDSNIADLKGIEYFTNLTALRCQNNNLTYLDLGKNTRLTQVVCMDNLLTVLDVTNLTELEWLVCWNNSFPDENAIIGLDRRKTEFFFTEVET